MCADACIDMRLGVLDRNAEKKKEKNGGSPSACDVDTQVLANVSHFHMRSNQRLVLNGPRKELAIVHGGGDAP